MAGAVGAARDGADAADARGGAGDGAARGGGGSSTSRPRRASAPAGRTWPTRDARPPSCRCHARSPTCTPTAGVLVNAVTPGAVSGELWTAPGGLADQVAAGPGDHARGGARDDRGPRSRSAGWAPSEEIAAVIAFLVLGAGVERRRRRLVGRRRRGADASSELATLPAGNLPRRCRSTPKPSARPTSRSSMPSAARRSASTPRPSARRTRSTSTSTPPGRPGYADVVAPPMFAVVYAGARGRRRRCSTPTSASTSR